MTNATFDTSDFDAQRDALATLELSDAVHTAAMTAIEAAQTAARTQWAADKLASDRDAIANLPLPQATRDAMLAAFDKEHAPATTPTRKASRFDVTHPVTGKQVHAYSLIAVNDRDVITVNATAFPGARPGSLTNLAKLDSGMTVAQAIAAGCPRAYLQRFCEVGAIALNVTALRAVA